MTCPKCSKHCVDSIPACLHCGYKFNESDDNALHERLAVAKNLIKESEPNETKNKVTVVLTIVAFLTFVLAFIVGIYLGYQLRGRGDYNFFITLMVWFSGFASGMFFYGLGEVVSLLQGIKDKR